MRFEYPSRLPPQWQAKARASAEAVIKALSFDHGLFNVELKITTRNIQTHQGARFNLVTLARRPVQKLIASAKHDATHLRVAVFQREIPVP